MKVCSKCGYKGNDSDNFCPKCAGKMEYVDDNYRDVFQSKTKVSNYSFVVKLVVGIVALFAFPFYRLSGLECIFFAVVGAVFSLSACAWYNKLSGFIPAFLFFLASCFFNGHIFTQLLCIVFMAFEISAGVKIKKKLHL